MTEDEMIDDLSARLDDLTQWELINNEFIRNKKLGLTIHPSLRAIAMGLYSFGISNWKAARLRPKVFSAMRKLLYRRGLG